MKLTADRGTGNYIQAFEHNAVRLNGERYAEPLIVSAEQVIADWQPGPLEELDEDALGAALDMEPEVIILGTGSRHRFVSNHLVTRIMSRGIGFEVMSTDAACRTYNILLAEDRRVVAMLYVA